ncbi:MAG: hypothetical protein N5P05_000419 [Chroococcopsis gigantea SAG 12.99]|jgi:drug/metabolite transporter (DMT)-like permease|nr:hypothetical protein [Chroococcopsis gigantea SAG 12.99]
MKSKVSLSKLLLRSVPPLSGMSGLAAVLSFSIFTAALDVYAGHVLQQIEVSILVFICFTTTAAIFFTKETLQKNNVFRFIAKHPQDVWALNITTAISWLGLFYALKYLEPAIVSVISIAIGPIFTIVLGYFLRRQAKVFLMELVCAACIFLVMLGLAWLSLSGNSAIGNATSASILQGLLAALLSGLASAANIVFSKRLSDRKVSVSSIMSIRFFLIIGIAFALSYAHWQEFSWEIYTIVSAIVISVVGTVLPLYLLHIGIEKIEPITVSFIVTTAPILTFFLQGFDRRLSTSWHSLMGILLILILVYVTSVLRFKRSK